MNHINMMGAVIKSELRYTTAGVPVLEVVLGGKTSGRVWYQRVVLFGKKAEALMEAEAGLVLHVHGHVRQDRWEDSNGNKRSQLQVIADQVHLVDSTPVLEEDRQGQRVLVGATHEARLVGNAVREAEVREAGSAMVCSAPIGITRKWMSNGEWREESNFFDLVAWSDQPAFEVVKGLVKGQKVIVKGLLAHRSWVGSDGDKRYKSEVLVQEAWFSLNPMRVSGDVNKVVGGLDIDSPF